MIAHTRGIVKNAFSDAIFGTTAPFAEGDVIEMAFDPARETARVGRNGKHAAPAGYENF